MAASLQNGRTQDRDQRGSFSRDELAEKIKESFKTHDTQDEDQELESKSLYDLNLSTKSALELLVPWCYAEHQLLSLNALCCQMATLYLKALESSISTICLAAAEDCLTLGQLFDMESEQSIRYMLGVAKREVEMVENTVHEFRIVRHAILELVAVAQGSLATFEKSRQNATDLQRTLGDLERFRSHINTHISWWNQASMIQALHVARIEGQLMCYSSIRQVFIDRTWTTLRATWTVLREGYAADVSEIILILQQSKYMESERTVMKITSPVLQLSDAEVVVARREKTSFGAYLSSFFRFRVALRLGRRALSVMSPPGGLDMRELTRMTEDAFEVMIPWCFKSDCPRTVAEQMILYAGAIDSSIDAAQDVFAICDDALFLAETITKDSAVEEVDSYLQDMRKLAENGLQKTRFALTGFRDVRKTILGLITDTSEPQLVVKLKHDIETCISFLETFASSISLYVDWWTEMDMSMNCQNTNAAELIKCRTDIRSQTFVKRWKKLRYSFALYANKTRYLQDRYPKLFEESRKASKEGSERLKSLEGGDIPGA
ncbi:hypothetical protein B0H34DRAFT_724550 [Crassisporium funariophilum]|nr:hypothetical protein B0H34DRAFT_724550 [Crassisporium funariophilum]